MKGIDLAALGRVAGPAGIALGVVALLLRDLIARAFAGGVLRPEQAGTVALVIAGGCILLGLVALLAAWPRRAPAAPAAAPVSTQGHWSPAVRGAKDVSIDYAQLPTGAPAGKPASAPRDGVATAGDLSPALDQVGRVDLTYGRPPPAKRSGLARGLLVLALVGLVLLACAVLWALLQG